MAKRISSGSALVCAVALVLGAAELARAEHVLQAAFSLTTTSVREELLVPLAFTGPKIDLGVRHGLVSGPHRLDSELFLGIGVLFNRFEHQAEQLSHGLALGYTYALDESPNQRLALGGMLRWQDELSYLESWDDAHGYWLSTLTLGPLLSQEWQVSSGLAIEGRGELALLGLLARPPTRRYQKQDALTLVGYHLDRIAHGTRAAAIWDLQAARLEAVARFRSARTPAGAGFGVGLHAAFSRTDEPRPYMLLVAGLLVAYGGEL